MKVLLDNNLPHELRHLLNQAARDNETTKCEVFTARFMRWDDIDNGDLLDAAVRAGFDVVITMDRGFEYEQNMLAHDIALVMLRAKSNSIGSLMPLLPQLARVLDAPVKRRVTFIG
jgi:predicted nuclease of predicted toxin-antitoxin system